MSQGFLDLLTSSNISFEVCLPSQKIYVSQGFLDLFTHVYRGSRFFQTCLPSLLWTPALSPENWLNSKHISGSWLELFKHVIWGSLYLSRGSDVLSRYISRVAIDHSKHDTCWLFDLVRPLKTWLLYVTWPLETCLVTYVSRESVDPSLNSHDFSRCYLTRCITRC